VSSRFDLISTSLQRGDQRSFETEKTVFNGFSRCKFDVLLITQKPLKRFPNLVDILFTSLKRGANEINYFRYTDGG
jgi:hypothetical protein